MSLPERVAKAMFDHDNEGHPKFTRYPWSEANVAVKGAYLGRALAAIQSMREPTEAMSKAGGGKHSGNDYFSPEDFPSEAAEIYTAMIDAALEKPE